MGNNTRTMGYSPRTMVNSTQTPSFAIAERFVGINGEGLYSGYPSCFIRLAGCNLECEWCDTAWANDDALKVESMCAEEIARFAKESATGRVTLTGGEPLAVQGALELIQTLLEAGQGVEVETNGSVPLDGLCGLREERKECPLHVTMDWKLPSSGMEGHMLRNNIALLEEGDALKLVIGNEEDLERVLQLKGMLDTCKASVFLSPVFSRIAPSRIAEFLVSNRLSKVRMQLQLHKIIWPNEARGV